MIRITDGAWIQEQMQQVKRGASQFATNSFATPAKLDAWISAGVLWGLPLDGCLFLLRKDGDFHHVYYVAASRELLRRALAKLPAEAAGTLVCDLVGRRADLESLSPTFTQSGYRPYASLYRMTRIMPSELDAVGDHSDVEIARPADAPAVELVLNTAFDRYAEQIPTATEIAAAIENANVLVVIRDAKLAGLLHFELSGLTATVRYWYVDPAYRNQGIASRTMRAFFARCERIKRIVLWVKAANSNAIARYEHLGFRAEDLVDEVMIAAGSAE